MRIFLSAKLQGAQIIGVTKSGSRLLENGPVTLRPLGTNLALEVFGQVGDDAVVVQQRIVNVEKEDNFDSTRSSWSLPFHSVVSLPGSALSWPGTSFPH